MKITIKSLCITLILLALSITGYAQLGENAAIYNIRDYGAVGDSITLDTKAIQKAIDACHKAGGGKVWVPAGDFLIGTIQLKSNVTLSLDYGASLLGSHDRKDYL